MREQIQVGDLVAVVKWPCCGLRLGTIFKVDMMTKKHRIFCCPCGYKEEVNEAVAWDGDPKGCAACLSWLKRIPPLSELEGEKRDEEITA